MTIMALGVTGSDAGLCASGVCQFLLTTRVGYPLLLRAWAMCLFSASLSGIDRHADLVCSGEERAGQ